MRNADMPAMPMGGTLRGVTKREYLAAMALPRIDVHIDDGKLDGIAQQAAKMAVETADAILAELEKTQ